MVDYETPCVEQPVKRSPRRRTLLAAVASCMMLTVIGCTYDTQDPNNTEQQTFEQRRAAAESDPMNYKIQDDADSGDIGGGGINNYDKNAMKRDMNDVLNP